MPARKKLCLAVIESGRGEILFLRRSRRDRLAPGLWGLPGGGMRRGETPARAMRRELAEELGRGLAPRLLRRLKPVRDTWYGGKYSVYLFHFRCRKATPRLGGEHEDHAWVAARSYRRYRVVPGVDEDLAHVGVWPLSRLNPDMLPRRLRP